MFYPAVDHFMDRRAGPCGCGTFVAFPPTTSPGMVIFGKNSDRPAGEGQSIRKYSSRSGQKEVQCTYISIPDVPQSHAVDKIMPRYGRSNALLLTLACLIEAVSGWTLPSVGNCLSPGPFRIRNEQLSSSSTAHHFAKSDKDDDEVASEIGGYGLYRPFAELAWEELKAMEWLEDAKVDPEMAYKWAINDRPVRIEIKVLQPTVNKPSPIRYARFALLETFGTDDKNNGSQTQQQQHSSGVQVLNLVVFPKKPELPVWGADFVSLPGGKHLVLLDAQPMRALCQAHKQFSAWHDQYAPIFPWGGDLPPPVQRYVSPRAIWTRMVEATDAAASEETDAAVEENPKHPVKLIQGELLDAFKEHLRLYLNFLASADQDDGVHSVDNDSPWTEDYLRYRLENDPARPMLKSLFGPEWTEKALQEVLFPLSQLLPSSDTLHK